MKFAAFFFSVILAMATTACMDSNRRMPAIGDTQAMDDAREEGQIRFERNTAYDGQVLSILGEDGGRPTLTTARNAVDAGEPYRPIMPGHSGWSWTLLNTAQNSTTYAYAAISWSNDDPTDYLAAGYWIHYPGYPPDYTMIEAAGFIDGPEIDPVSPPQLPIEGQANYRGLAGGSYRYLYGASWGNYLIGSYGIEEYAATVTLTADFSANTISGCIGCQGDIVIQRTHLHDLLGDHVRRLRAPPTDYELHLGAVSFNPDGTFELPEVTVMHPERTITQSEGFWGGGFSSIPDAAGNPRLVAGFSNARFEEADGSRGSFWGMFNGLSTTWLNGDGQEP